MSYSLDELKNQRHNLNVEWDNHLTQADHYADHLGIITNESKRVASLASDPDTALQEIDAQFKKYTALTDKDVALLFIAVGLQVARQYLLTQFPERKDDKEAADSTRGHTEEHSNRHHRLYRPSLEEIITNPVPFDVNKGSNGAFKGSGIMGHRAVAIGHDPVLGYVFGTANIATATVTLSHPISKTKNGITIYAPNLDSYHVKTGSYESKGHEINTDWIGNKANTQRIFCETEDKLFHQGKNGVTIVLESLLKEHVHLQSDINTKHSLPLPGVSFISPALASELYKHGLDMCNVSTVGKQMGYALLINLLIGFIHDLMYDPDLDGSKRLYEVRTRKILSYSNLMAESSNVVAVAIRANTGDKAGAVRMLDIGGLIVLCHRLISDAMFISQVKTEFIQDEFFDRIRGSEYDFLS